MKIKSNTPLSDNELRKIKEAFDREENLGACLYDMFPNVAHCIKGDTVYLGLPPWDLTQEIDL